MIEHRLELLNLMQSLYNPDKATALVKFFQAYPGGYGEGDRFYGIAVPEQHKIARQYVSLLSVDEIGKLIMHPVHEVRLTALLMLVRKYQKCKDPDEQKRIVETYLSSMDYINNWDLVDSSAPHILGPYFLNRSHNYLLEIAQSGHLWMQRIAILTTQHFIRNGYYKTTLDIALILLKHKHDLIHKAVGWMLREVGDRDYQTEYEFLKVHYKHMPRTMLRYAIEKFDENVRQAFLKGTI